MIYLRAHHLRNLHGYVIANNNELRIKLKDERVMAAALEDKHSRKHGQNAISILKKALDPDEEITIIDSIDDICNTCNKKRTKACREFIPYGVSAASDDRGTAHVYGLKIGKTYPGQLIQKRLLERGTF